MRSHHFPGERRVLRVRNHTKHDIHHIAAYSAHCHFRQLLRITNYYGEKNAAPRCGKLRRSGIGTRSVHVVANAHRVVMLNFGVAHGVMMRSGDGGQRRGHGSAQHQGGQTGERLGDDFHAWTLDGQQQKAAL
ncbi:hypothetical protein PT2222_150026 [Paraburkholderia tropica]